MGVGRSKQTGDDTTRKRRCDSFTQCDIEAIEEADAEAPSAKRRNVRSTSEYIYSTLFEEGVNSDVTIVALGREWRLHRHYLSQQIDEQQHKCSSRKFRHEGLCQLLSPYFRSMFSGQWKESQQETITLDIPDEYISVESFHLALGSLYKDDVSLTLSQICPTMATASLFQMDGLKKHCIEFMTENLRPSTVVYFLSTCSLYGVTDVAKKCRDWLLVHLVLLSSAELLREMPLSLLEELLASPDLFVMQVEMDIYTMLKKWLFLHLNPTWNGNEGKLLSAADTFFRQLGEKNEVEFLQTTEGAQFEDLFSKIRYGSIISDTQSVQTLDDDKIVPQSLLLPLYKQQWMRMLTVEQAMDPGPSTVRPELFASQCTRCGRVLSNDADYCWRWTGYSFGVDLLVIFSKGEFTLKRNVHSHPCSSSVSLQERREVAFRLRIATSSEEGEVQMEEDTGLKQLVLAPDEEQWVLSRCSPNVTYPLYVSMNFCITGLFF